MLAAVQKWPSGRLGASAAAARPASMPFSRSVRRPASGACVPSQYWARASFHAASYARGLRARSAVQMAAARLALSRCARSAYRASGLPGDCAAATQIYNKQMQELIRRLLAEMGENPTREGLLDTPKRVEKAYRFLTSGYDADIDQVLNNALFTVDYSETVMVKDV